MRLLNYRVFTGRNIYSHKKCIRFDVDLEGYNDIPSKDIKDFNSNLLTIVPELKSHRCGIDEDGGFVIRLNEGTYLSHICEHIILAIQNTIGIDVCYGKSRQIKDERYYIIFQYEYKNTGVEIGKLAIDIINSLVSKKPFNFNDRLLKIRHILEEEQLGPSTLAIIAEAKKRNIPVIRIDQKSLIQLGYGASGEMLQATIGSRTSAVAVDIACDKLLTKEILQNQFIPVAIGQKVLSEAELCETAKDIGYPIVLKPRFGNQGKGVVVNIKMEKELLKAYKELSPKFEELIIERYVLGRDYRVCLVSGKVIAVSERIPPYIIGDGLSSINNLIEKINSDTRRGEDHNNELTKIKIDCELLMCIEKKNFNMNSILPSRKKLVLRKNANLSTGGTAIDCTDIICPENIDLCERVAKAIGLDICGVDLCCKDISIPMTDRDAVIEVNAAPGIRMHHYPTEGASRNVAGAIVDLLYNKNKKDIPIIAVTGTNGKTTTTRLIAYVMRLAGYKVGMTTTGGIFIDNKCISSGDTTGFDSAMAVLLNKEINAAVLETARGGMIRAGLAYDLADVGVITNITDDHLGIDGIDTIEEMAKVKALVGEAVKENGYVIINADDDISLSILERIKHDIIYFAKRRENLIMQEHLSKGGYGVYSDDKFIYAERDSKIYQLARIDDIGITMKGKLSYNVDNAMAASAALIGVGISYISIRRGLTQFCSDDEDNPGRFNSYQYNGATIILDYAHNIEGYKAVLEGLSKINHKRLVGIIGVPGDRRDQNIVKVGEIAAGFLDNIIIKEDEDKRGREIGHVAKLLEEGIVSTNFNKALLEVILDEGEAFKRGLDLARPGDLIIIFFEQYAPLMEILNERINEGNKEILKLSIS